MDRELEEKLGQAVRNADELQHKRVLFPHTRHMRELFESWELVEDLRNYKSKRQEFAVPGGKPGKKCYFSSYCGVNRMKGHHTGLDVVFHPEVLSIIRDHMLMVDDYVISPRIVIRENGVALVIAQYEQILGDRWLAFIDPASIEEKP
jgi:hypothetical protein